MESIWRQTVEIEKREPLKGDRTAEVVVIGAGMAGLLTAYYLQKQGREVIVLEADRIGSGQTQNTTAKITSQHGKIYSTLIEEYGEEQARLYARANEEAVKEYGRLVKREKIDCHFERTNAYLYSFTDAAALKRETRAAGQLGISAHFTKDPHLPFPVAGAVCFEKQAQFHPLEFLKGIAEQCTIYEQTPVIYVEGHIVHTKYGRIKAKHIVFATHYPFPNMPGFYFARQHQERSYVLAISGVPKWEGIHYSVDRDGLSFRWFEDILLVGGGGHRTGKEKAQNGYRRLAKAAKIVYPQCDFSILKGDADGDVPAKKQEGKVIAYWSAQDCLSHDDLPFIGRFSMFRPYWYVATGFKKWGMTSAMISANIISDQICGTENPYEVLFTPQRMNLSVSWNRLLADLKVSVVNLIKGHFYMPIGEKKMPGKGKAKIMRIGSKRYGVYRDLQGGIHKVSVQCPHLGCELSWNRAEKSWDCPCHGSRFDYDGNLIDNPAQVGLNE